MPTNLQESTVQRRATWANPSLQWINQSKDLRIVISGCPSEKWLEKHPAIKKKKCAGSVKSLCNSGVWKRNSGINGVQVNESRRPRRGPDNGALSITMWIQNNPITKKLNSSSEKLALWENEIKIYIHRSQKLGLKTIIKKLPWAKTSD